MADTTGVLSRWTFDEDTAKTIAGLIAGGWTHVSTCTYAGHLQELHFFQNGIEIEVNFRFMSDEQPVRNLGNRFADEGLDRCVCGSKYWENDRCVDCDTHVLVHRARIVAGA
jgi:hypothetical protein